MVPVPDFSNPVGWTRQSNIDGFLAKTYDVISFWRRGPDVENMSDVPVYVDPAEGRMVIGSTFNYDSYIAKHDATIACWPHMNGKLLYIDNKFGVK